MYRQIAEPKGRIVVVASIVNAITPKRIAHALVRWVGNRYGVLAATLIAYTWAMSLLGGMPPLRFDCRFELPLLLGLYYLCNRLTRPSMWQPLVAAIPILLPYIIFDVIFMQFGRLLRIVEVREVPELMAVLPFWMIVLVAIFLGGSLVLFIASLRIQAERSVLVGGGLLLTLFITVEFSPDLFLSVFEAIQRPVTNWSDIQSAEDNGRIWMMLYHEAKRNSNIRKIAQHPDNQDFLAAVERKVALVQSAAKKRNIHLIVLESFVDPELFKGLTFSRKPVHPDFDTIFKGKGTISLAPLFGGGDCPVGIRSLGRCASLGEIF